MMPKIAFFVIFVVLTAAFATAYGKPCFAAEKAAGLKQNADSGYCNTQSAPELLDRTYHFKPATETASPAEISVEVYRPAVFEEVYPKAGAKTAIASQLTKGPEDGPIVMRISRPDKAIPLGNWQNSSLLGAAQTDEKSTGNGKIRVYMAIRERTADAIVIDAKIPPNLGLMADQEWTIVPILCDAQSNKILGFASTVVKSVPIFKAWFVSLLFTVSFWLLVSYASYQLNKRQLEHLWETKCRSTGLNASSRPTVAACWKFVQATSPLFISQDSLGVGSLARFQILVFTTVVGFVLLFIFVHSGFISNVSDTILLLLGVTVAGGTLARAAGDWKGMSPISRRWLIGASVLTVEQAQPRWADLFETQGEMDVAKVQAMLFTFVISLGILASGYGGFGSFNLPPQLVYLSFLSQGAYVGGKFLPAETRKRLEDDLEAMRTTARALISKKNDAQLKAAYAQAKRAAKTSLEQTYSERFNTKRFDENTVDPKNVL